MKVTTLKGLEIWLSNRLELGIYSVYYMQGCYTISCSTSQLIGGARVIVGCGRSISETVENAEKRIAELAAKGTTPHKIACDLMPAGYTTTPFKDGNELFPTTKVTKRRKKAETNLTKETQGWIKVINEMGRELRGES